MTHKIYDRSDEAFVSALLLPPTGDVLARLMSPQDRGRLMKKDLPSAQILAAAIQEVVEAQADNDDDDFEFDGRAAGAAIRSYIETMNRRVGPYANYPEDYNYLAHAIGSSTTRYEDWFIDLGGLHITPGVTAIFAETGAGKTTMADLVAFNLLDRFTESSRVMRVKLGESGSDLETFLRFSELAAALPEELPPVIIIDSVRLQTFDMGGASRSLSISNRLFRWLTEIDIFAIGHGISVILVMNPLAGEEEKIEQFRGDVESSVMAVVNLESWNTGSFKHRGEKNARQLQAFTIPGEIARRPRGQEVVAEVTPLEHPTTTSPTDQTGGRTAYGRKVVKQP